MNALRRGARGAESVDEASCSGPARSGRRSRAPGEHGWRPGPVMSPHQPGGAFQNTIHFTLFSDNVVITPIDTNPPGFRASGI